MQNEMKPPRVFVYRNLTKKMWSIRDTATRRVIGYSQVEYLKDVTFKVSESGRQRVLSSGHKNVHAGVEGTRMSKEEISEMVKDERILEMALYNPRLYSTFIDNDRQEPIYKASYAILTPGAVYYLP